ncbi:OmpA family protein [Pararhizobium sp.]|uniref:OmpA family protein n=1 Tax=Pararhizobium sp. TaxID=1977563 RepID=UPI0027166758|nr:OmpA family protein [Pararhizobium sp.]MDO9418599.1 OmpA family protein [Pararhizobium sp.]
MFWKAITIAGLFTTGFAMPAEAACDAMTKVIEAFNARDKTTAVTIARGDKTGCSPKDATVVGRIAALTAFNDIFAVVSKGGNLFDHEKELLSLKTDFGGPWQIFDALGDINRDRRNYADAGAFYQTALENADDTALTPDWMAPDEAYIVRLDHMATEMRLASSTPVKLAMRGACKTKFRGVALKKKSTPVRYVFGKSDFTEDGLKAAKDLYECLKSVQPYSITLIGHTDPVGSSQANKALSLARADALAKYLVAEGYTGQYKTEGKGEDDPFKPDDASAYDAETLNQLNRRVEVDVNEK